MSKQHLTRKDIEALIPHRDPMLLIDEITNWESEKSIEALCHIPADSPLFDGHFPGNPVLPGMLNFEAIAQAAAVLISLSRNLDSTQALYLFGGVEHGKFYEIVKPGQVLRIKAEKVRDKLGIFRFEGSSWVGDKRIADVTFTAKLLLQK